MESGRCECDCKKHSVSKCEVAWRIFSVVTASLSVLAIALSLASFIQSRNATDMSGTISQRAAVLPSNAMPMQEAYNAAKAAPFPSEEDYVPTRTVRKTSRNKCSSKMTNGSIPIAHIASTGASPRTVTTEINKYPVLTKGWSCLEQVNGYIKGGMSYSSQTGFLTVPVDGLYFVYSQITVNTTEPLGHVTFVCSCVESSPDCDCLSDDGTITSSKVKEFLSSNQPANQDFSSNYHGSVKYLEADSQLALIPPLSYSGEYTYFAEWTQAYFGAFLISQLPTQAQDAVSPAPTTPSE